MKLFVSITLLIISIIFAIIVEHRIKKGKLKRVDTYSYRHVIRAGIRFLIIAIILSLIIFLVSNSLEVTLSLGIFFLVYVAGVCLYAFLIEYQKKRRGGKKID